MTRIAAYVVLIFLGFILAAIAPSVQVSVPVRGDAVRDLAHRLGNSDPRSPSSPVPILWGREIYDSSCASCHGHAYRREGAEPGLPEPPAEYSPSDIHRIITLGHATGPPEGLSYSGRAFELRKDHPAFPVKLTDSERWAVAVYLYSEGLDPGKVGGDFLWVEVWRKELHEGPDAETSGAGLYQRLCASCHGPMGYGNGPLARDLLPHPKDLRDLPWLAYQSDQYIFSVISDGKSESSQGSAAGWSGMPAWGEYLDEDSIARLVAYLRSFGYSFEATLKRPGASRAEGHKAQPVVGALREIPPDSNQWTWAEIRAFLPNAPTEPPEWMTR